MALAWVLFNLTGTLVDPTVLAQPLGDSGADEELVLSALDDTVAMAMVDALTGALHAAQRADGGRDAAAAAAGRRRRGAGGRRARAHGTMPAYLEAPGALESLRARGLKLGVLAQSSADATDAVLRFAGLRDRFELVLSAQDAGAYKPDLRPYRLALEQTGADAGNEVVLRLDPLVGRRGRQAGRPAHRLGRPPRALAARHRPAARLHGPRPGRGRRARSSHACRLTHF